jgi:hypothetical protein
MVVVVVGIVVVVVVVVVVLVTYGDLSVRLRLVVTGVECDWNNAWVITT